MCYPSHVHSVYSIDVIGSLAQQILDLSHEDELGLVLQNSIEMDIQGMPNVDVDIAHELMEICGALSALQNIHSGKVSYISLPITDEVPLPYFVQAPKLELKPLPDHLKYAYLEDGKNFQSLLQRISHQLRKNV